jgi:hypothetical protein
MGWPATAAAAARLGARALEAKHRGCDVGVPALCRCTAHNPTSTLCAATLQVAFTDLLVHTLDNVPPDTLSLDVANITGSSGQLQLTLNEPSTTYFVVLPHGPSGPGECPAADQVGTAAFLLDADVCMQRC